MQSRRHIWTVLSLGLLTLVATFVAAAPPVKRARPPKFPKSVTDVFFPDAREKLVGDKPQRVAPAVEAPVPAIENAPTDAPSGGNGAWSKLISAEAIEDEIKAQERLLGAAVASAAGFKGGGYQQARAALSVLAVLFAIDAEYGQPMRWQREAAVARDQFARAGFNCKVGTDASFKEAQARHEELATLVRGGSLDARGKPAESGWSQVADRAPLMKRLEQAYEQGLAPWTASSGEFNRRLDRVAHEAQLVAALAAVIQRDGYEFADDESYREPAEAMRTGAIAVREATANKNFDQARQAVSQIGKSCTTCHEGYRN